MRLRLSLLLFLAIAAPADAIVGGKVTQRQWPAQAQLQVKGEDGDFAFTCGASLVRPSWVLTAAHCVEGVDDASRFRAVLGRATLDGRGGETLAARAVKVHPEYDGTRADVALIELERASSRPPIRVLQVSETDRWRPGTPATVIGWGARVPQGPPTNELHEVEVPVVDDATCDASYTLTFGFDPATMLCAGETLGGRDSCNGDSGGPLMVPDAGGILALAGVVSFGTGCALPTQYGVYGRIADTKLRSWLDANLPATGAPAPGTDTGAGAPAGSPPPPPPGGGSPPPTATPVRITFARDLGGARSARRRRQVPFRVRTSARVTDVRITVRRIGSRRLSQLSGRRRLVIRLSRATARRVRPGRYTVSVTARDAQGRTVRARGTARLAR